MTAAEIERAIARGVSEAVEREVPAALAKAAAVEDKENAVPDVAAAPLLLHRRAYGYGYASHDGATTAQSASNEALKAQMRALQAELESERRRRNAAEHAAAAPSAPTVSHGELELLRRQLDEERYKQQAYEKRAAREALGISEARAEAAEARADARRAAVDAQKEAVAREAAESKAMALEVALDELRTQLVEAREAAALADAAADTAREAANTAERELANARDDAAAAAELASDALAKAARKSASLRARSEAAETEARAATSLRAELESTRELATKEGEEAEHARRMVRSLSIRAEAAEQRVSALNEELAATPGPVSAAAGSATVVGRPPPALMEASAFAPAVQTPRRRTRAGVEAAVLAELSALGWRGSATDSTMSDEHRLALLEKLATRRDAWRQQDTAQALARTGDLFGSPVEIPPQASDAGEITPPAEAPASAAFAAPTIP